ncbi:MAG: hypothetical protein ACFFCI_11780 [Promethearchaeota archaeon]
MIDAKNLTKKSGNTTAVEGLTLHEKGGTFGLLGINGAVKTN